jgi:hypothetical protein
VGAQSAAAGRLLLLLLRGAALAVSGLPLRLALPAAG